MMRYYWFKLDKDFFKSRPIKKLRKISGGDTFTIIYMKMILSSLPGGGRIYYTGIEDTFEEELALDLDESVDDVKITVSYLLSSGLMEEAQEDEYEMIGAVDGTISEGSSAKRMRDLRGRALQCNAKTSQCDGHASQCDAKASLSDVEIDIEKEKELEIDKESEIETEKEIESESEKETERGVFTPDVEAALLDFKKMRKAIKKPMTDRAYLRLLSKLEQMSAGDPAKAVAILEQSIDHCWADIYELKNDKKTKSRAEEWLAL